MLLDSFFWISVNNRALFTTAGTRSIVLSPGAYKFILRGGGGAGGENNGGENYGIRYGGAGGMGELITYIVNVPQETTVNIGVGAGGGTYSSGGNGGAAGLPTDGGAAGAGGGGGYPSYVECDGTYYVGQGGGGGGGAGSNTRHGRFADGGSGGGGGGYYRLSSDGILTSVPGATGGRGSLYTAGGTHTFAENGAYGNTIDFPSIWSGHGGEGDNTVASWRAGGASGYGGGASGGGGGCGLGNDASGDGGAGGGGAGGSMDAGGGQGGAQHLSQHFGQDGYNYHTTATSTTVTNANVGVNDTYGMGGNTNTAGTSGFVLITKSA